MEKNEKIIEIRNLCKYFQTKKKLFKAVDDLNISIKPGDICGFIGPNGAGKTTTIKMIVGATNPTSGEILIDGKKVPSLKAKSLIGYIPEKYVFYNEMLPRDYLIYLGQLSGLSKDEAEKGGDVLLQQLELDEHLYKKIGSFSSGMKQKLALAQAIIHNPKVLILDEPTANLDPVAKYAFLNIIKTLAKEHKVTVLISSHHLEELEKIIDQIVILDKGKLVLESNVKDLKLKTKEEQLEIEATNPEKVLRLIKTKLNVVAVINDDKIYIQGKNLSKLKKDIINLVMKSGEEIISISGKKKSLEELFLGMLEK